MRQTKDEFETRVYEAESGNWTAELYYLDELIQVSAGHNSEKKANKAAIRMFSLELVRRKIKDSRKSKINVVFGEETSFDPKREKLRQKYVDQVNAWSKGATCQRYVSGFGWVARSGPCAWYDFEATPNAYRVKSKEQDNEVLPKCDESLS